MNDPLNLGPFMALKKIPNLVFQQELFNRAIFQQVMGAAGNRVDGNNVIEAHLVQLPNHRTTNKPVCTCD